MSKRVKRKVWRVMPDPYLSNTTFNFRNFRVFIPRMQRGERDSVFVAERMRAIDTDDCFFHLERGYVMLTLVAIDATPGCLWTGDEVSDERLCL